VLYRCYIGLFSEFVALCRVIEGDMGVISGFLAFHRVI